MMLPNRSGTPLYGIEQGRNLHNAFEVLMDDKIDGDHLKSAVTEAVRQYPPVGYSVVMEDGLTYFVPNDNDIVVPESAVGIIPGSEALNGHMFCVSYSGNRIRSNVSHVITDGSGMNLFARAVLRNYCRIHYGTVISENDRIPDEVLLKDYLDLDYSDTEKIDEEVFIKEGFILPETIKGRAGHMNTAMCVVHVPEDSFMEYVKANHTSPSVMLFLLFAEAVYNTCPESKGQPIAGRITVNARRQLGIPDSFVNCSLGSQISVTEPELESSGFDKLGPVLRASLKRQLSPDYLKYVAAGIATTHSFPRDLKPTFTLSYMGPVDIADCKEHIVDISLYEGEVRKLNAYTFRGEFRLAFHFGEGSHKYAQGVTDILTRAGINAECDDMVIMPEETEG